MWHPEELIMHQGCAPAGKFKLAENMAPEMVCTLCAIYSRKERKFCAVLRDKLQSRHRAAC